MPLLNLIVILILPFMETGYSFTTAIPQPPKLPQKIISNTLLSDEILTALHEIDPTSGLKERIVGLSEKSHDKRFSNIGENKIAEPVAAEPEQILQRKADLVILASFNRPEYKSALMRKNIKILELIHFDTLEDLKKNISSIGEVVGVPNSSKKLLARIDSQTIKIKREAEALRIERKRLNLKAPRILSVDAQMMTMAKATIFDEILTLIGSENVASQMGLSGWPKIPEEMLASDSFDLILLPEDPHNKKTSLPIWWAEMANRPAWKLAIAKNQSHHNKFLVVPEPLLYTCSQHVFRLAEVLLEQIKQTR